MGGDAKLVGKHEKVAKKALSRVAGLLEKLDIKYFLEFGTLLGIVRENRLLPWDDDLDISITDEYLDKLLKNKWKIWLIGYRTRVRYFRKDIGNYKAGDVRIIKVQTRKWLFFRDKAILDIFIMKREGDDHTYALGVKPQVLKSIPATFHDKQTQINFNEKDYFVSKDYKGYLEYVYGDWKTPVKGDDWDFRWGGNCKVLEVKEV